VTTITWPVGHAHVTRESASVCATVTSQVKGLPRCHGVSVMGATLSYCWWEWEGVRGKRKEKEKCSLKAD